MKSGDANIVVYDIYQANVRKPVFLDLRVSGQFLDHTFSESEYNDVSEFIGLQKL